MVNGSAQDFQLSRAVRILEHKQRQEQRLLERQERLSHCLLVLQIFTFMKAIQ